MNGSDSAREKQHQPTTPAANSSPLIICFGGYAIVSRFHFNKTLLFKYYRWIVVVVVVDVVVVNDQQTQWIKKGKQVREKKRKEWVKKRAEQNKHNVREQQYNLCTINKCSVYLSFIKCEQRIKKLELPNRIPECRQCANVHILIFC